jgi:hypothetical protein
MTRRAAMWPSALTTDKNFVKLGPLEQLLFMKQLWLSPHLDSAGFHPLQISKWARGFTPQATEAEIRQVVGNLEHQKWIAVDYDTEEVFVIPFIRLDAARQPQIYVAACRAIQAAQSSGLRGRAWEEILIVHPPKVKHDSTKFPDPGSRLDVMQQAAYEELRDFMDSGGWCVS